MEKPIFNPSWLQASKYPSNFIPKDAEVFFGFDKGSPDGDCTVIGFYKDGEYCIQSVEFNTPTNA